MPFFLSQAPTYHSFNGIFHFSTKCMGSFTLKHHNSLQNQNNRKNTQFCSQTSDFLVPTRSFKTQLYLRELELPKNLPGDKFFKLTKSKF